MYSHSVWIYQHFTNFNMGVVRHVGVALESRETTHEGPLLFLVAIPVKLSS